MLKTLRFSWRSWIAVDELWRVIALKLLFRKITLSKENRVLFLECMHFSPSLFALPFFGPPYPPSNLWILHQLPGLFPSSILVLLQSSLHTTFQGNPFVLFLFCFVFQNHHFLITNLIMPFFCLKIPYWESVKHYAGFCGLQPSQVSSQEHQYPPLGW